MPGRTTVLRWLATDGAELGTHPDLAVFRGQYARACEDRADAIADEILEIADDASRDYPEHEDRDGNTVSAFDAEHVQRSKLRVDARKWLLAKMAPKKYGDRVQAEVSGPGGASVPVAMTVEFVRAYDGKPGS